MSQLAVSSGWAVLTRALKQAAAAAEGGGGTTVIGTYGFMAPEQFRGASEPASDLYALGGTLLFLLSGGRARAHQLVMHVLGLTLSYAGSIRSNSCGLLLGA